MAMQTHKMTASEATSFERMSVANAVEVIKTFACGCQPYKDVFTFNRWKAQGFFVRRGEHALKLPVLKHAIKSELADDGTKLESEYAIHGTSYVFCRHQVEGREVKE